MPGHPVPELIGDLDLVDRIHSLLLAEGGFTVDALTGRSVDVGLAVCADPVRWLHFRQEAWNDGAVLGWVRANRRFVASSGRDDLHLGGWSAVDRNQVHLDVVRVVPPERAGLAHRMGRWNRQRAVFDLGRRALVLVAGT
jgi:hypothetical protein